ncbi:unnamed protein product, partial [Rotaria sp. Silwood2]
GTPGILNSITDVCGVEVEQLALIEDSEQPSTDPKPIRTEQQTFGAWYSLNGNEEMTRMTWLEKSGFLAPIIAITNRHSIRTVRDAAIQWITQQSTGSVVSDDDYCPLSLPVVAETWDGFLNDINGFHVQPQHLFDAIRSASSDQIAEGNVGGGTGMVTHEFKGGIGTSSRKHGEYTVGVLVQSNYGRRYQLTIADVPIGEEMLDELLASSWTRTTN